MINVTHLGPADPVKIIVGASSQDYPGWIPTQEEDLNLLNRSDWEESFGSRRIDVILSEHVWEHLTYDEGMEAARICFDYLKPGGYIRCAVPDGNFPNEWYQNMVKVGGPGPADHPAASHKIVHTYRTLTRMFEEAGFKVRLLEYCDDSGAFHREEWDPQDGFIYRSYRFDHRNKDGELGFVSLIVDAVKE
ncbi:methyltransferase domain-containing protein [Paenibacillus sp. CC-CFT747]|nr:methyltransferase domain-containing protein [Paenibacillus sp. CC-CFT747]